MLRRNHNRLSCANILSNFGHIASLVACIGMLLIAGCESSSRTTTSSDGKSRQKLVLMLNWYPEAEHGGFYAAQVHGIFEKYGLDVEIRPGGESAPVAQELLTGRVQFAIGNADDVLLFRQQKADIVALLAPIQQTPRCIMVRADSGITALDGLKGKGLTLQANEGQAFLNFMKKLNMLDGVQIVPYLGSVAQFVADKNTAIQAYNFSEPQLAEQQGVPVKTLMLGDIGFNPYASCLMATGDYVKQNKDVTERMVAACREGWQKYLESPQDTNAKILSLNTERMTKEALDYGVEKLKPLCQVEAGKELGHMTLERWQKLVEQFVELKLVDTATVKAEAAFVDMPVSSQQAK